MSSNPAWGRSPGGGYGNPLQYSCLENPHGQRRLTGYSSQGCAASDMTEATWHTRIHSGYYYLFIGQILIKHLHHGSAGPWRPTNEVDPASPFLELKLLRNVWRRNHAITVARHMLSWTRQGDIMGAPGLGMVGGRGLRKSCKGDDTLAK